MYHKIDRLKILVWLCKSTLILNTNHEIFTAHQAKKNYNHWLLTDFGRMVRKIPRGGLTYERGADARWKFWNKLLEKTDLGMAKDFLTPKKRPC